ncbi:hypothetical protein [Endozoicomonas euniceicola]|uniref:Uncharacterized protein n=1 Tax=Endozoicomonas euniceicola TaxID=1234143 RepID=A0ABY6GMZ9_9GAMM|nr:hypothetical protein [Endozoicomonas euniceicola]UYM14105.1 hypothetical protein NX720_14435 [Endozoicomonas euniceicola]
MSKTNKLIRWLVAIWFMAFIINPCQSSADSARKKQEQQETTSQPGLFLQQKLNDGTLNKKSLVILDLDDTTITTPEGQWLGRSEMFYYLVNKEMQRNPGRERQSVVADIDPCSHSDLCTGSLSDCLLSISIQTAKLRNAAMDGEFRKVC